MTSKKKEDKLNQLVWKMIDYYEGDAGRIQHFVKVSALVDLIARNEGLGEGERYDLSVVSVIHDVGTKAAVEQYGYCNAKLQERLGPAAARNMLDGMGFEQTLVDHACAIVGRIHTYEGIEDIGCQILVEADLLANLQEGYRSVSEIPQMDLMIFKTRAGKTLLRKMYPGKMLGAKNP